MPGDIEEQKELKELLSRGEVKTMQKDLAILREKEAEKEKERIIALKTDVEETARVAKAKEDKIQEELRIKKEAETAAKIAKEREEKIREEALIKKEKILKEAMEKAMKPLPPSEPLVIRATAKNGEERKFSDSRGESSEKEAAKGEIFNFVGSKTREMWRKEEEENQAFIERVKAKAITGEISPPPPPPVPPPPSLSIPIPSSPPSAPVHPPAPSQTLSAPLPTAPLPPPLPPPPPTEELGTLIPKPPRRPSPIQKVLVRIIILLIILLVVTFGYWFFFVRKIEIALPPPAPAKPSVPPTETPQPPEVVFSPASLIQVGETLTLTITTPEEVKSFLTQTVTKKFEAYGFTRILLKDAQDNKYLGLKEFFTAFDIKTPEGLLDKLDNNFTLFIFTSAGTNRLGFIAEIKDKTSLPEILNVWEKTVEKDTESLFLALGKDNPAPIASFRTAYSKGNLFRYISFPQKNFGICWAIVDNRLIFTSSGESMIRLIDELQK